ncbi:MAG: RNA polymerase sigma factor [Myxococcota bacterium]
MTTRVGTLASTLGLGRPAVRDEVLADLPESVLIGRATAGDRMAFGQLVLLHEGKVRALLLRLTSDTTLSDDLAQEVFLRAFRGLVGFRGHSSLGTWLYRIAYNVFLNHSARSKRFAALPEDFDVAAAAPDDAMSAPRSDMRRDVRTAIATLPDRYRAVVVLYYLQEVTYPEIAEILDLPLGTVKTHLHRAKRLLRRAMDGDTPTSGAA